MHNTSKFNSQLTTHKLKTLSLRRTKLIQSLLNTCNTPLFRAVLISSALSGVSPTLFANTSVQANQTPVQNSQVITDDQYYKNMVNEWVKFKLMNDKLEQKGAGIQEKITELLSNNSQDSQQQINAILQSLVNDFKREFNHLNPQSAEIKKLSQLHLENIEMMLKVMPQHFKIMQNGEENEIDTEQHFKQFMEFAGTTSAANEYELEVEHLVLQYLNAHPLK